MTLVIFVAEGDTQRETVGQNLEKMVNLTVIYSHVEEVWDSEVRHLDLRDGIVP